MTEEEQPRKKHDLFFKKACKERVIVQTVLQKILPKTIVDNIDINSAKHEKTDFTDDDLNPSYSDVLLSYNTLDNKKVYTYILVEHQSSSDHFMAHSINKYMSKHLDRLISFYGLKSFPLTYPIVIYSGKEKYSAATNIADLFDNPDLAKEYIQCRYHLLDLQKVQDDQIEYDQMCGYIVYVMKYAALKNIQEGIQERDIEIVKNMLAKGFDIRQVCLATQLSEEEINKIQKH